MDTKGNNSEEIDLGQLFKLIIDGFNNFFQWISNIFRGFFHLIILLLQFLRIHFIKFVIAGVVGLAIGWYLDHTSKPLFRSSMIVEPNFNSAQQLYNNIEFYNELVKEGEYQSLATALKISDNEAGTIDKIKIESFTDENQKILKFSNFISSLDSTSRNIVQYRDYLKNFNDINSKFHKILLESSNPSVAKKCQKTIVRSIENNEYFQIQKKTNELNLKINDSVIRKQLREVDSLRVFYQKLKILEINRPRVASSTSINLSSENQDLDRSEIALLNQAKLLNEEILTLNQKKADSKDIINVISDFPEKGALMNDFFTLKKVILPISLIALTLLTLIFLALNKYLKNYNVSDKKTLKMHSIAKN